MYRRRRLMALSKHRKLIWIWLCTLLGVALSSVACLSATFVIQQYEGDPLPMDRIAILRLVGGDEVYLASLDGEGLDFRVEGRTDRIHVEMLPGDHELGIARQPNGRVVYRRFTAKAGVIYQPKVLHNRLARGEGGLERWTAGVFEVEPATGELVRDVSESPYSLLPPPPAPGSGSRAPEVSPGALPAAPSEPAEVSPAPSPSAPESAPDVSAAPSVIPAPTTTGVAPSPAPSGSGTTTAPPPTSAPLADPLDDRLPKPPPQPPAPSSPPVPTSPPAPAPPVPTSPPPPVPTTPPHPGPPPQPK